MATKIEVKTLPTAEYKGRVIVKIGNWYKVQGRRTQFRTLVAATDSIK